ncbi:Similar to Pc13g00620 [Penicillium chrysogenum Wisconsin 54-1255]; acc. no. XP_002558510 [Pyronema omphalodes CBS 100304]|uniref:Similar to Pc13g00620 [Penicillium chrysogenum Wisconsin 54-1255] acc. no. XP_002558510 n=1 Tax=Pyronema omphalodes (strain CBS 100304) TaxID=1076935 RepID=U4KZV8_PYROM|nr:Similar to Pc13g00620 [Penicillium chrysogenum Wisconsin 54-1255]; acc. no. XP_002558510 [Pyronema omphalodes CBS 100304]
MAEAALGLALGVPGVIDILIKTCLEGYQFISTARSADEDFENNRYQFKIEQQKLKDLTTIVASRIQESTLKTDDVRFLLISSTLIRIAQQFSDFRRLESQYGVQISSSDKSAEKQTRRKRSQIRKFFGLAASKKDYQKDTRSESDAFETVLTLTDLQLDANLRMATLENLEPRLKSVINTYSRLKWACLDSEKAQTLIIKLQKYNSNMKDLVDGHYDKVGTTVVGVTTEDQPHFMVPFPRNEDFVGESQVTSWFKSYQKQRIESGKPEHTGHLRLALCGLGGIGKTQDVLNFIYDYENQRPVFWIHAGSVNQFEADCRKLGSLAKIPGHRDDDTKQNIGLIVKQWLESPQSGEWILVIDNADNMLDFYPDPNATESRESDTVSESIAHGGIAKCIPRGSKGTVIITTRDREVARYLANQNVISKPELRPEQATELFYQHYSNDESTPDHDSAALPRLLLELQHLPLAIVQVAVYLDLNRSMTTSRYLEIFKGTKEAQKHLLSKPHRNIWRDQKDNAETVLTTFSISFRQLQQQSKLADSFLQFMACINRKAIPRDLLFEIKIDGVEDELLISEALEKLVNFSILQNAKIDFGSGQAYEIHSLVHLAMQTYLESNKMDNALAKASTVLANTLPDPEYKYWTRWRVYLPHATALLANLAEDSEDSADLCCQAGQYLADHGRYSESLILRQRARERYVGIRSNILDD